MLQVNMTDWVPWGRREELPEGAGAYVIAKKSPEHVVYIGKTWGEDGLRGRLRAFERSATTGGKGHSGGVTYFGKFGSDISDLIVSAHVSRVIKPDPVVINTYVLFVERWLLWEHVQRHGQLPICNDQ